VIKLDQDRNRQEMTILNQSKNCLKVLKL